MTCAKAQQFTAGKIQATIEPRTLTRADIFVLRMIKDNTGRPIYFSRTSGGYGSQELGLGPYLVTQGLARKLVPDSPAPGGRDTMLIPGEGFVDVARSTALWDSVFQAPKSIVQEGRLAGPRVGRHPGALRVHGLHALGGPAVARATRTRQSESLPPPRMSPARRGSRDLFNAVQQFPPLGAEGDSRGDGDSVAREAREREEAGARDCDGADDPDARLSLTRESAVIAMRHGIGRHESLHLPQVDRDSHRRDVYRRRALEPRVDADDEPEPSARRRGDRERASAVELLELVARHRAVRVRRRDVADRRRVAPAGELRAVIEVRAIVLRVRPRSAPARPASRRPSARPTRPARRRCRRSSSARSSPPSRESAPRTAR